MALLGPAAMSALRPLPGVERTSSVVIHAARIYEDTALAKLVGAILLWNRQPWQTNGCSPGRCASSPHPADGSHASTQAAPLVHDTLRPGPHRDRGRHRARLL